VTKVEVEEEEEVLYKCDKDGITITSKKKGEGYLTSITSSRAGRESYLLSDNKSTCSECKEWGI